MSDPAVYKSKTGHLTCTPEVFFNFTTDIRSFRQFIPGNSIKNWQATAESCSFTVSPMGDIVMNISRKEAYSLISFSGNAFQNNEFKIDVQISEGDAGMADVSLVFIAYFNPLLKMMASAYVDKFLETLIGEMEKFNGWSNSV